MREQTDQAGAQAVPEPGIRAPQPGEGERTRLFRNANVVDVVAGEVRPDTEVLVAGGRFERVGSGPERTDAEVIDLGGAFVMPGLIDLHVHPGMMVRLRTDPNGQSPERIERDLGAWLRYGVTTVQAMGTDRAFSFEVQRRQEEGAFPGARLFSVGHGFGVRNGVPPFQMDPPGPVRPGTPEEARRVVEDLCALGASGVKIWYDDWYGQFPKMAPEIARAIVEVAGERGLTSYAHVYRVDDAKWLIGCGLRVLAHMPRDREVDEELIEVMRERGAAVIPTLAVPESNIAYVDRPAWVDDRLFGLLLPAGSREYLQSEAFAATIRAKPEYPELRPDLERAARNVGLLYEGGVRFGFGTDAGVSNRVIGFYEHRELELLVGAGVKPADALRMATADSAQILGQTGELGEIAPGARADFVVLEANPFEDVRNTRAIRSVWLGGVEACGGL